MNLLELMLKDLPFTEGELGLLIATSPRRYKTHLIDKRNNRGQREISQPTAEVKLLQRWVVANVLSTLPVHDAATAYVKGKSITDHAAPHARSRYLLKLDFRDFFPSIRGLDVVKHVRKHTDITHEDASRLARILCRQQSSSIGLRLSIGAPSSPAVSNCLMFAFDERLHGYCKGKGITYTRYADDLALSTNVPHILDKALEFVQLLCNQLDYPKLSLNEDKTVFSSKKFSRQLTGVTLANDGRLSIGRLRKRHLRVMAHRSALGLLTPEQTDHLRGLLAFVNAVEPAFIATLRRMIGKEKMLSLFPEK